MTKGQKAMAHAVLSPETQQGKKGTSGLNPDVDRSYVNKARKIIRHKPELVPHVLSAAISLNNAYDKALKLSRLARGEVSTARSARYPCKSIYKV